MKRHRTIASTVVVTVAVVLCAPACALAGSPLLSGYGGPGSGQQVLLGGGLIGGSGGSGGRPGGGSGVGSNSASASTQLGTGSTGKGTTATVKSSTLRGARKATPGSKPSAESKNVTSAPGPVTYPANSQPGSIRIAADSSVAVGLSGLDLLLIVLAIGVLVLTGVFTRRLARLQR
jgi:hypothetical protein